MTRARSAGGRGPLRGARLWERLGCPECGDALLAQLVRAVRRGGWILVYLYQDPAEQAVWKGALLSLVSASGRVTTRLPMEALCLLTWFLAAGLWVGYIGRPAA